MQRDLEASGRTLLKIRLSSTITNILKAHLSGKTNYQLKSNEAKYY